MNKLYEEMTNNEKTEAGIKEILGKHLNSTIKEFDYGIGFALIGEYENIATQRAEIEFEFKAIEKEIMQFLEIRQEIEIQKRKLKELKSKEFYSKEFLEMFNPDGSFKLNRKEEKQWDSSTQAKAQAQAEAPTKAGDGQTEI